MTGVTRSQNQVAVIISPMRAWLFLLSGLFSAVIASAQPLQKSYEDSLVLAPLYVEYTAVSAAKFASEANELRRRIGEAPHVMLGFAGFVWMDFDGEPHLNRPIDASMLASTLRQADLIVDRARENGLITHIGVASGLFHGWNRLREIAIREDVRNAQWFADGWIASPAALENPDVIPRTVWITPSRYAQPLRNRLEESFRML